MGRLPPPTDDPTMRKLVTLLQEELPNSASRARKHLLERLYMLEGEALQGGADPRTLRSIRAAQHFVLASDPLMGVWPHH